MPPLELEWKETQPGIWEAHKDGFKYIACRYGAWVKSENPNSSFTCHETNLQDAQIRCLSHALAIDAQVRGLEQKIKHYVELLDKQSGTPCEQIRHREEMEGMALVSQAWLDGEKAKGHILELAARLAISLYDPSKNKEAK